MLKNIILLFFLLAIIGCDSSVEPLQITPSSELFPLSVGNYWRYEDNFSSADTIYTNKFTILITDVEEIGNYRWFKFTSEANDFRFYGHLMIENDSVYSLQQNFTNYVRSLEYIIPKGKEQSFYSLMGGDVSLLKKVVKLDTVINTKIGAVKNCFKYEYSTPNSSVKEILAFGIGIIEKEEIGYSLYGEEIYKLSRKILSARIKKVY